MDDENDINIDLTNNNRLTRRWRYFNEGVNQTNLTIKNSDLKDLYNKISTFSCSNLELYSNIKYEIAVEIGYSMPHYQNFYREIEDSTNGLKYTIGRPTI